MMTRSPKTSPRNEYLLQQNLRVEASPTLAEEFPELKSMTVDLGFYNAEGRSRRSRIKYKVNVNHARTIFRVGCENPECVRGDFDLSDVVAQAVANQSPSVSGELACRGWRNRTTVDVIPCGRVLRYRISLAYEPACCAERVS